MEKRLETLGMGISERGYSEVDNIDFYINSLDDLRNQNSYDQQI